ncbi:hypothetical protein HWV00_03690 [Moritella sp. 24]|uniref:lipase secretion chaperone n=1 Tax=Moritella sp. 24 TaxID=2746230 RepID=UPI001BA8BB5C|nr:lipase secretion chaperone [Moritella sp. 24]QUM75401.1 hypothetical protein HWV00_03690 [Moritella sp. 24]
MKKATLAITIITAAASVAYIKLIDDPIHKQTIVIINPAVDSKTKRIEAVQHNGEIVLKSKDKKIIPSIIRIDNASIQAVSQQDTEIDQASLRDMFDYFLSGFNETETETDIEHLKMNVKKFITNSPEHYSSADYDLFERFLLYKQSLLSIDINSAPSIDDLERLDSELRSKQLALFSPEEQTLLFNNENLHRQVTIKKQQLQAISVSQVDYNYLLKEELSNMPDEISRVYQDDLISAELNQVASNDDAQQRYITYEALLGSEAAVRMTALEQQEARFNRKVNSYLAQRKVILNDDSNLNKETHINELRDAHFNATEQKRIRSLEYISDL